MNRNQETFPHLICKFDTKQLSLKTPVFVLSNLIEFTTFTRNMTWTWKKHVLKYWKKSNRFNTFMLILFYFSRQTKVETSRALHKKWSFPLRISSVNVTKSAVSFGHGDCVCMWRKKLCNCLSSLFPSSSSQCF